MSAPIVERLRAARIFTGDRMVEMPEALRHQAADTIEALLSALEDICRQWPGTHVELAARAAIAKARAQ